MSLFLLKELTRDDLHLTEEEKEVLRSQGLPIPTCLPLTSAERKALQAVRRRLKAKVHNYGGGCVPFGHQLCCRELLCADVRFIR